MTPEIDKHLKSFTNFPSPPTVAAKLVELAKNPNLDIKLVADTLAMDPVLTTKILRVANSPLYAKRRKSETLRQALVVLGVNSALTLGLSFSLLKSLRGTKAQGLDHSLFLRRSLLTAVCARSLGEVLHSALLEELFLAALIQDIGILAIDKALPELYANVGDLQSEHEALCAHERRRCGQDHAAVGAWLLESWGLPERIVKAVRDSHGPLDPPPSTPEGLSFNATIALSGPLADFFLHPDNDARCDNLTRLAQASFGLDAAAVTAVMTRIRDLLPDAEAVFETKLASNPDDILARASELLATRQPGYVAPQQALA